MNNNAENRANERQSLAASIVFSYFNKEQCFEAQTLNHCAGGVCFKSEVSFKPGATIYLRVKKFPPKGSYSSHGVGLPSVSLAEIKWCREIPDPGVNSYEIGVKYFDAIY